MSGPEPEMWLGVPGTPFDGEAHAVNGRLAVGAKMLGGTIKLVLKKEHCEETNWPGSSQLL